MLHIASGIETTVRALADLCRDAAKRAGPSGRVPAQAPRRGRAQLRLLRPRPAGCSATRPPSAARKDPRHLAVVPGSVFAPASRQPAWLRPCWYRRPG